MCGGKVALKERKEGRYEGSEERRAKHVEFDSRVTWHALKSQPQQDAE